MNGLGRAAGTGERAAVAALPARARPRPNPLAQFPIFVTNELRGV